MFVHNSAGEGVLPSRPFSDTLTPRMKYGIAVVWDAPYGDRKRDEAHALCICDCVALKLREINDSMLRNNLPAVDFMVVMRDEKDLKP